MAKFQTKNYPCPHECGRPIETRIPNSLDDCGEKGYWDSAVQCPHCNKMNFKKVFPGGKIEIIKI